MAIPGVEPDRDALRPLMRGLFHQHRVAHRSGADDDAIDPFFEPGRNGRDIADAAAELNR